MPSLLFLLLYLSPIVSHAVSIRKYRAAHQAVGIAAVSAGAQRTSKSTDGSRQTSEGAVIPEEVSQKEEQEYRMSRIERARRQKVQGYQQEYNELQARLSGRRPWQYTVEERHEIALLRMKLSAQMSKYNQRSAPEDLKDDILSMRNSLPKQGQYKNPATRIQEERAMNLARVRRWHTRQKAKGLGVNISVKIGRKPINDDAPAPIKDTRDRNTKHRMKKRMMKKLRKGLDKERHDTSGRNLIEAGQDLLHAGWTRKKKGT